MGFFFIIWVIAELLPSVCILASVAAAWRTQSSLVHGDRADKKRVRALLSLVGRLMVAQFDWSLLSFKDGSLEKHRRVCAWGSLKGFKVNAVE